MPHPKDSIRTKTRRSVAVIREYRALELYVAGLRQVEIAKEIGVASGSIPGIIKRGLHRMATELAPDVEMARQRYVMQLEQLLRAWWPLATGTYMDDETGQCAPPDFRAATMAVQLIDKLAMATAKGVVEPAHTTNSVTVNVQLDGKLDVERRKILDQLDGIATKMQVVDGELAGANASLAQLTGAEPADATPEPPPVIHLEET